ncbi:MAG: hypothetical protein ACLFSF_08260 [Desulfonatronovibrio sp.]
MALLVSRESGESGNLRPIWHWTDSKIRCHILCCIIALTNLRLISLWLKRAGIKMSIDTAMAICAVFASACAGMPAKSNL